MKLDMNYFDFKPSKMKLGTQLRLRTKSEMFHYRWFKTLCLEKPRTKSYVDEFYLRWFENSVAEIREPTSITLIFNHLN